MIYVLAEIDHNDVPTGFHKIGYVSNDSIEAAQIRARDLQTGNHRELVVVGHADGCLGVEANLHRRFHEWRVFLRGRFKGTEWFRPSVPGSDLHTWILSVAVECDPRAERTRRPSARRVARQQRAVRPPAMRAARPAPVAMPTVCGWCNSRDHQVALCPERNAWQAARGFAGKLTGQRVDSTIKRRERKQQRQVEVRQEERELAHVSSWETDTAIARSVRVPKRGSGVSYDCHWCAGRHAPGRCPRFSARAQRAAQREANALEMANLAQSVRDTPRSSSDDVPLIAPGASWAFAAQQDAIDLARACQASPPRREWSDLAKAHGASVYERAASGVLAKFK